MINHRTKHGERHTRLYNIWACMKTRCKSAVAGTGRVYHDRGITYAPEWETYLPFRDWALANGYQDGLTIERKNVNGNYTPGNCTFIPSDEQKQNRRKPCTCRGKVTTSTYKGASRQGRLWAAQIRFNKKRFRLGLYLTQEEAAYAYNVASLLLFHGWADRNVLADDALGVIRKAQICRNVTGRLSSVLAEVATT